VTVVVVYGVIMVIIDGVMTVVVVVYRVMMVINDGRWRCWWW
jgi:hypothetical protein